MINKLRINISYREIRKFLGQFILPLMFVCIILLFYPERAQFEAGTDEGINLIKAMLVDQGYVLYDEIWSDQPPLFTQLLAIGFQFVGYKVGFARYLVLSFSFLLIWSAGRILDLIWGKKISLMGMILIMLLPTYLNLSVSVLIGLPSISFAMLALWAIVKWHIDRRYSWLVVSAVLMGFSVLTKIFLGFLGPIFCLGLLVGEHEFNERKVGMSTLLSPLIWGLIFSSVLIIAGVFWVGLENINQLWEGHVAASSLEVFGGATWNSINYYLSKAMAFVILGVIGIFDLIKERKWLSLYALFWVGSSYLLLDNHSPVWSHHQLIVTVPLVLLAAPPATKAFQRLWNMLRKDISWEFSSALQIIAVFSLLAVLLPYSLPGNINMLSLFSISKQDFGMDEWDKMFMAHISLYKDQTDWIVTDLPIYAFRSRLSVPPEIAVFSQKRLETGEITDANVIRVIEAYQPEQALIGRFDLPELREYLDNNYTKIYTKGNRTLYIRNDIKKIPIGSGSS